MIMMSKKIIVCFIAFLDTENIWFGEIILHILTYFNHLIPMGLHMLLYHVYRAVFCGIRETTKSAYARMAII